MASYNKFIAVGRLTRDPEPKTFSNGGKMVNLGFVVNNRKKNQSTGEWEDAPTFIDAKIFNRGDNGKQADLAESSLHKGSNVLLEGKIEQENWEDKNGGGKRSKLVLMVDNFQFLDPANKSEQAGGDAATKAAQKPKPTTKTKAKPEQGEGEIPF